MALDTTCAEAGCRVTSVSYADRRPDDTITVKDSHIVIFSQSAELDVRGHYGDVVDLIETLECRDRKVWIERFHLSLVRSKPGVIQCHIKLTVYVSQIKESGDDEPDVSED